MATYIEINNNNFYIMVHFKPMLKFMVMQFGGEYTSGEVFLTKIKSKEMHN